MLTSCFCCFTAKSFQSSPFRSRRWFHFFLNFPSTVASASSSRTLRLICIALSSGRHYAITTVSTFIVYSPSKNTILHCRKHLLEHFPNRRFSSYSSVTADERGKKSTSKNCRVIINFAIFIKHRCTIFHTKSFTLVHFFRFSEVHLFVIYWLFLFYYFLDATFPILHPLSTKIGTHTHTHNQQQNWTDTSDIKIKSAAEIVRLKAGWRLM